jgi:hypothetical protein
LPPPRRSVRASSFPPRSPALTTQLLPDGP